MSAEHKEHLSTQVGIVEIALVDPAVVALSDNLSNAVAVIEDIDALSFVRVASVTDLKFWVNTSDEKVEQRADDTGVIYSAYTPVVKITMNWLESGNIEALEMLLWMQSIDVTASGGDPAYKVTGQTLKPKELPQLIVRITGANDSAEHKELIYLFDSGLNGEIAKSFVDITRTKEIPSSALEFIGNPGGFWLNKTERLPA